MHLFKIKQAAIELSTTGMDAIAIITLTVIGDISDDLLKKSFYLFEAAPASIAIPGTFFPHLQCRLVTIGQQTYRRCQYWSTVNLSIDTSILAVRSGLTLIVGDTAIIPPVDHRELG
jgi:hypothetical protein